MKPIFTGVCTALVTPFNRNGSVDYISFKKLIEHQIAGGVRALLFLGTTGEAPTLSLDERKQIVGFAVKAVQGRVPIVVGIGGNNPASIIEFGKFLQTCHCERSAAIQSKYKQAAIKKNFLPTQSLDCFPSVAMTNTTLCKDKTRCAIAAVLLSSPYYNKATRDGLVTFFHTIANAVRLPLIAYNVPSRTGQNIDPETFALICKNRYIAGIKEASGNITNLAHTVRLCPRTAVYSGDDATALPAYAIGARGVISVASNIAPRETQQIFDLFSARKLKPARVLYTAQLPLYRDLFTTVNPIPVKYMLSQTGLIKNHLRLPLTPMKE